MTVFVMIVTNLLTKRIIRASLIQGKIVLAFVIVLDL